MSKNIGADAVKLIGLQIDMLQKLRAGQITLEHLEWFKKLSRTERDTLLKMTSLLIEKSVRQELPMETPAAKFALLVDLGTITIPADNSLATFDKNNRNKLYYYNPDITDENFPNPTHILKPGDKLWVRAFKQVVPGITTSKERLAFLKSQNALLVGAQGIPPVFEQKRDLLLKGYCYTSLDNKSRLWCSGGCHGVPDVFAGSGGGFGFSLGDFEDPWDADYCLLCFCDYEE